MPTLSKITANYFVGLITRLGVRPPPDGAFELSNIVIPVSIVDTDVPLTSVSSSQLLDTPFTAGPQAAPPINTVLADTGAQNAGNYLLFLFISLFDSAGAGPMVAFQRRDLANAANIWEQRFYGSASANGVVPFNLVIPIRGVLGDQQRFRFINLVAGGAGSTYHCSIFLLPS
jgi:hypothetical protein